MKTENNGLWYKFWVIPWTFGWLVTIGMGLMIPEASNISWSALNIFQQFIIVVVYYLIWPIVLGNHIK